MTEVTLPPEPNALPRNGEALPQVPKKRMIAKELLPVWAKKDELLAAIKGNSTVFLIAGTGTGKTRGGAQIALEAIGPNGKMVMTENLRKATEASAATIAEDREEEVGNTVGFQNRYHRKVSEKTRLLFCPMQSLLNKVEKDPLLMEYELVMVDEVHKESKQNEILLATLRDIQAKRAKAGGKPLKIVLTSATMDEAKLGDYFPGAKKVEVAGANIPVTPDWHDRDTPMKELPGEAAKKVAWSIQKGDTGNMLVFLSGKPQIDEAQKALAAMNLGNNVEIVPFYGGLTKEEQREIDRKIESGTKRIIFLATNAAQESLTWPIQVVIDSCTHKQMKLDRITGRSYLMEEKAPLDHLTQRKGRVGRKAPEDPSHPDRYYPLTTKADWESRKRFETAEIQRTDLTTEVLTLLASGYDPHPASTKENAFKYLNKPDRSHIDMAYKRLQKIGAVDTSGTLTEKGQFMATLQLNVNNASLVADGLKYGALEDAAALAAMLEVYPQAFEGDNSFLAQMKGAQKNSDLIPLINLLKGYGGATNKSQWVAERGLRLDRMKDTYDLYKELLEAGQQNPPPLTTEQLSRIGAIGLDIAINDSFADTEITGFKRNSLMVKGVGGSASIRIDRNSALFSREKTSPTFVSTDIRTIMERGSESKIASLNHALSDEVIEALYEREHPSKPRTELPPAAKPKADETSIRGDDTEVKTDEETKAETPPEQAKKVSRIRIWWEKTKNWLRKLFG